MDLTEKIRTIPLRPGVYLYKNAEGEVIYVGKAKNLRARVRSYFQEGVGEANAKTGSLLREAVDAALSSKLRILVSKYDYDLVLNIGLVVVVVVQVFGCGSITYKHHRAAD